MFYDDHGYARAAAEYERQREEDGCTCEPKVISRYRDEDGMWTGDQNCDYCDCKECEHHRDYEEHLQELQNEIKEQLPDLPEDELLKLYHAYCGHPDITLEWVCSEFNTIHSTDIKPTNILLRKAG